MLEVEENLFDDMIAHARRDYPEECCGLLVGRTDGDRKVVVRVLPAANVAATRRVDRFEIDPAAQLEADAWARARGLDVVGCYHSHPDHPPDASPTDNERAVPGWHDHLSFLILSVRAGEYDRSRCWILDGDRLIEEPLRMTRETLP